MTDSLRVQELLDRLDIRDRVAQLARGMDRHDADLMASAYHPDAYEDHGSFRGLAPDFIEHVNGTDGSEERTPSGSPRITISCSITSPRSTVTRPHAETYFLFVAELRDSHSRTGQIVPPRYSDDRDMTRPETGASSSGRRNGVGERL